MVDDPTAGCGLLEVKCPYKCHKSFAEAVKDSTFFLTHKDEMFKLKVSHQYYYQVQFQLYVSEFEWCDFVVWSPKELYIERIRRNAHFFDPPVIDKLPTFYFDHLLPAFFAESIDPLMPISDSAKCAVCHLSDQRILRSCFVCSMKFHHMCQNLDEEGKKCNSCFKHT